MPSKTAGAEPGIICVPSVRGAWFPLSAPSPLCAESTHLPHLRLSSAAGSRINSDFGEEEFKLLQFNSVDLVLSLWLLACCP